MVEPLSDAKRRELRIKRYGEEWLEFAGRWSPSQLQILTSEKQYLFALGGNGAGKTKLGTWWLKSQIDGYDPIADRLIFRQHTPKFYAIAPTSEKIEQVLKPELEAWFPKGRIVHRGTKDNDCWTFSHGERLMWKTGKQDVQTYQSDEIDDALIDEEIGTEEQWKGVLSRGFRRLARVLCTMTAEKGTLWFHSWIFSADEYPMEEKEIVSIDTRENPYYYDCDHCSKPKEWHAENPRTHRNVCLAFDNAKGQRKLELRVKQCRGVDFDVRIRGLYLLGAGASVIDPVRRMELEKLHRRPPLSGYLNEQLRFVRIQDEYDSRSWLRIAVGEVPATTSLPAKRYLLTPVRGHQYVIGVDAAEGNPLGDWHAAVVIDAETGDQCALAHTRSVAARDFGTFIVQLARYYNDAYVVVEANNHGGSIIDTMIATSYGHVYTRAWWDTVQKKPTNKIGFWTNNKTKKPAVDLMARFFENRMKIHDPIIFGEAYAYTWLKESRTGTYGVGCSNPSGHDDTMTALFCASAGLRRFGWDVVSAEDAPQKEYQKTIHDALVEDASGATMSDDEAIELQRQQDEQAVQIEDVYVDGDPSEWIP